MELNTKPVENMSNFEKPLTGKNHFPLEATNDNKIVRWLQLAFGVVCFILATIWIILNITSFKSTGSVWLTIAFLYGFSYFEIISGLGKAARFVEFGQTRLTLKRISMLPAQSFEVTDIVKIEIFPLSIIFFLKSGKRITLRLGTRYGDIIESVRNGTEEFAQENNIPLEYKKENI
jgi:hypothetical protein